MRTAICPGWWRAASSKRPFAPFFEEAISVPDQRALGATLDDPGQRNGNHIRHLLFRDPAHKNDERSLRIHFKTEFRLQRRLAYPLAGDVLQLKLAGRWASVAGSQIR